MKNKTSIIKVEKILKINIGLKLLLCLPLIVVSPLASSNDRPKIAEMTIFGVMIGDDANQVIKGLTEYFSITEDELEIRKPGSKIQAVYYSFDQIKVSVYLADSVKNSEGEIINVVSGVDSTWRDNNEWGDKVLDALSESITPSIIADIESLQYIKRIWCDTLNAAKDDCGLGSDGLRIIHRIDTGRGSLRTARDYKPSK